MLTYYRSTIVFRKIRKYQKSKKLLISKSLFQRFISKIAYKITINVDIRFQISALKI